MSSTGFILVVTDTGYGLLMKNEFTLRHRGKLGNKSIKTKATGVDRNGKVVAVCTAKNPEKQEVIIVSENGQLARFPLSEMRILNSNSQGVRVMDLAKKDKVASVVVI